jgi:hypothetical protein
MMQRFWIAGLLTVFLACSGKDERAPGAIPTATGGQNTIGSSGSGGGGRGGTGTGGRSATSGTGGGAGEGGAENETSGGEGGEANVSDLAPVVEITSPADLSDPNDGVVVSGEVVDVVCKVTASEHAGALAVDEASVKVSLLDGMGKTLRQPIAGVRTAEPDEYKATFQISDLGAGVIKFRCTAGDQASPARMGSQTISTFIDRGPIITRVEPTVASAHALKGAVAFEFSVAPDELVDDDSGAAVDDVTLTVDGVPIKSLAPAPKRPGVYVASVDFNDPKLFPLPPTGNIAVVIEATNSRKPDAITRKDNYNFILDGEGPTVKIASPADQAVLRDKLVVTFSVVDKVSGVDPASIYVTIKSDFEAQYHDDEPDTWTHEGNNYTFTIDSSKVPDAISQVNVTVRASDMAGNGPITDSLLVNFDPLPPFVSLDPPKVRVLYRDTNNTQRCSGSFDPLGDKAANDLQPIREFQTIRAFVWDLTPRASSQEIAYYAGVDPAQTYLYIAPAANADVALVVDNDGDGTCDRVAPEASTLKGIIHLDLVPPAGSPDYAPTFPDPADPNDPSKRLDDDYKAAPDVQAWNCVRQSNEHPKLCATRISDMEFVTSQVNSGQSASPAAIYAAAVGAPSSLQCTGSQIDVSNIAPDGWVCVAAVAMDDVGNLGVSRPLRLCLDSESSPGTPACATSSTTPPTCTDGCTPPSFGLYGDDSSGHPMPFPIEYVAP